MSTHRLVPLWVMLLVVGTSRRGTTPLGRHTGSGSQWSKDAKRLLVTTVEGRSWIADLGR